MIAKIIISANEDETRMGLLENGILMEYLVERKEEQHLVGSIFKGKVCNVVRGIQAAFVDIGLEQNAFLYLGNKRMLQKASLIVQILRMHAVLKVLPLTAKLLCPDAMLYCCRRRIMWAFHVRLPIRRSASV